MSEPVPSLVQTLIAGGTTLIVGALSFVGGHSRGRASFIAAVQEAAHIVIVDLQTERADLRTECARVKALHETCESRLDDLEAENLRKRDEIAQLMAGRVAGYGEEPPA